VSQPAAEQPSSHSAVEQARALVERAVVRLGELEQLPVAEHVDVLDDVHRSLQDALATLDEV
jgi:hypothetical protein